METDIIKLLLENPEQLQKNEMDLQLTTLFMSGGSSLDTKFGHKNEPIIMDNAVNQSYFKEFDTIHSIIFSCQVELVTNKGHKQIYASPGFLLNIEYTDGSGYIYLELRSNVEQNITLLIHIRSLCQTGKTCSLQLMGIHTACHISTKVQNCTTYSSSSNT